MTKTQSFEKTVEALRKAVNQGNMLAARRCVNRLYGMIPMVADLAHYVEKETEEVLSAIEGKDRLFPDQEDAYSAAKELLGDHDWQWPEWYEPGLVTPIQFEVGKRVYATLHVTEAMLDNDWELHGRKPDDIVIRMGSTGEVTGHLFDPSAEKLTHLVTWDDNDFNDQWYVDPAWLSRSNTI